MTRTVLIAAVALGMWGCDSGPQIRETNASVGEVAAKVRNAEGSFVRPGEWQSKVVIEQFDMPGMPPEAASQMKAAMAENQRHEFKTCLTPEDVKQPKGKFFGGEDECRYDHFNMGNGKIDAVMRCPGGPGPERVMKMAGTYGPERYDMRMTMTGSGSDGPAAAMTMKMRVESRRLGNCPAGSANAG